MAGKLYFPTLLFLEFLVIKGIKKDKIYFPSENQTQTIRSVGMHYVCCATLITAAKWVLILVLISFYVTRWWLFIDRGSLEIDTSIFLGKCFWTGGKSVIVD